MSIVASVLGRLLASTELLAVLSVRSWLGVAFGSWIVYLASSSQLARPSRDAPCAPFGLVFRILYGLFGTRLAVLVLGRALHTRKTDPTPDQHGGTRPTIVGEPNLRVKIVPILGSAFGGNYAFLVWDEADEQRRAIVVDPSDPHVVLRAAEAEGLNVELLLCTHWHFDHSSGNGTFKRYIKRLQVVASAHERGYVPAVTRRLRDLEEIRLGRLVVRGHHAPGHTRGSMLFEVFNSESDSDVPPIAFTGDTLFCGGCGALFECSATVLHASLQLLVQRLPRATRLYPGHEYTEMLVKMAVQREPRNAVAQRKLEETRLKRARKEPTVPSTLEDELQYNAYLRADTHQLALMCGAAEPDR